MPADDGWHQILLGTLADALDGILKNGRRASLPPAIASRCLWAGGNQAALDGKPADHRLTTR